MTLGLNVTEAVLLKQPDRRTLFANVKAVGINEVRLELPWQLVKNSYTTADAVMTDAAAAGLNVLAMVAHNATPKPSAAAYGTLMGKLAKRYPQVKYWEVWNEQNLQLYWPKGNPETYVPYLKAAATEIRANSPAKVVFGGLAAAMSHSGIAIVPKFPFIAAFTNTDPVEFLTRAYAAGAKGYFDVVALHPYTMDGAFRWLPFTPAAPYVASIDKARAVMDSKGDTAMPIWATEYGYPISSFTTDQQVANLAAQTDYLATKVARQYIYSMRDYGGSQYGMVDAKNNQRPAYAWLKGLT